MIELYNENETIVPVKLWNFPVGESGVQVLEPGTHFEIYWVYESDAEIMQVLSLANALQKEAPDAQITLTLPYLPYSRQDRVCAKGEALSLEVFGALLNTFRWVKVFTEDVHNFEAAKTYIRNLENIEQYLCAIGLYNMKHDLYIAPDAGAMQKVKKHPRVVSGAAKVMFLSKSRKDDRIVYDDLSEDNKTLLAESKSAIVVDDLGDGMGTFIALAENLKKSGVQLPPLDLYVTHGFFTKGDELLKPYYRKVYVAHNYNPDVKSGYVETI